MGLATHALALTFAGSPHAWLAGLLTFPIGVVVSDAGRDRAHRAGGRRDVGRDARVVGTRRRRAAADLAAPDRRRAPGARRAAPLRDGAHAVAVAGGAPESRSPRSWASCGRGSRRRACLRGARRRRRAMATGSSTGPARSRPWCSSSATCSFSRCSCTASCRSSRFRSEAMQVRRLLAVQRRGANADGRRADVQRTVDRRCRRHRLAGSNGPGGTSRVSRTTAAGGRATPSADCCW